MLTLDVNLPPNQPPTNQGTGKPTSLVISTVFSKVKVFWRSQTQTVTNIHCICDIISETEQNRDVNTSRPPQDLFISSNGGNSDDLEDLQGHLFLECCKHFQVGFFAQLCSSWQNFNSHSASRGPTATAEFLVVSLVHGILCVYACGHYALVASNSAVQLIA